jgi:hypothetical protein
MRKGNIRQLVHRKYSNGKISTLKLVQYESKETYINILIL